MRPFDGQPASRARQRLRRATVARHRPVAAHRHRSSAIGLGSGHGRLALWSTFLAWYSGRRGYIEIDDGRPDPVDTAGVPVDPAGLCRAALEDRAGAWIVAAHLVKTTSAAVVEADATGAASPLAGAARFVAAPRRERFVARNVRKALQLADGRVPD